MSYQRILVVEDRIAHSEILTSGLQMFGFEALSVQTAEQAIELLFHQREHFKAVIIDVVIPHKYNGLELAEMIIGYYPEMIVILYTGYGSDELKAKAKQIGVKHFLTKPQDIKTFVNILKKAKPKGRTKFIFAHPVDSDYAKALAKHLYQATWEIPPGVEIHKWLALQKENHDIKIALISVDFLNEFSPYGFDITIKCRPVNYVDSILDQPISLYEDKDLAYSIIAAKVKLYESN